MGAVASGTTGVLVAGAGAGAGSAGGTGAEPVCCVAEAGVAVDGSAGRGVDVAGAAFVEVSAVGTVLVSVGVGGMLPDCAVAKKIGTRSKIVMPKNEATETPELI
ncbi:MAG: hypothetical protein A2677_01405 [Candidatus Komeilibacteria bacterium RIFCSPHIGHO2_01_FULL_52_14]|uniref:Uncharacterized protein n=1 Tax=Candidatus Komeilibacteria bacterium RIFCSPHIGHO2_01_FULL_52_14 TaxID=1798549 RepID=A0A1G2BM77_9BACT|nr:MAG: hypothetical protein A2677_01405 [Candidatus Komeilibacteria bacterium RIFCSPHIGHO2_01_FULL_52_14]